MRLIDTVRESPRRLVVPLAGYPGIQLTGSTIKQNEFNAELQARTLYKLAERVQPDALFTMMDLSVEAGALGMQVRFPLQESATVEFHPVRTVDDLDQYKVVDPLYDGRIWVFTETVRLLKQKLSIPVGAYVIGPFTLAGLMMGATEVAVATLDIPQVVLAAVNFCEDSVISVARALEGAGADLLCILDPTASILSPTAYARFAGPAVAHIVRRLDMRTILHICGNVTHLVPEMAATGVQGLSLGPLVDLDWAMAAVPDDIVVLGNVDPVATILHGDRERVRHDVEALLERIAAWPNFIVATGCDVPAEAPLENLEEMVRTVKAHGA